MYCAVQVISEHDTDSKTAVTKAFHSARLAANTAFS